jgi:prevent-host-death family protein
VIEMGAIEAKDKFSRLLDRVQLGEEIVVTRRGKPVARIVPNLEPSAKALAGNQRPRSRAAEAKP